MKKDYKILLDISREDLNASKVLYENGFYPQALFYFQQSVEKLIKYLALKDEVIEPKDLQKKISHNSSQIFRRAILRYKQLDSSNIKYDINKEFQALKELVNQAPEDQTLDLLLENIFDTLNDKPDLPFDIEKIESYSDLYDALKIINPDDSSLEKIKDIDNDKLFKPIADKMLKEFKTDFDEYIRGVMVLFLINIISEKLVSSVRYPDVDKMNNPSEKYNNKNSLILKLATLHKAVDYCQESIENI